MVTTKVMSQLIETSPTKRHLPNLHNLLWCSFRDPQIIEGCVRARWHGIPNDFHVICQQIVVWCFQMTFFRCN